jgi:peptidyl-prolyl cis-trans isomerase C
MFSANAVGTPTTRSGLSGHQKPSAQRQALRLLSAALLASLLFGLAACNTPFGLGATPTPTVPTPTPAPPTATPEPAVATVNGERVPVRQFQVQLAQYKAAQTSLGKTVSDEDASKAVLEDMLAQVLLAQAARAAGFELSDSALQARIDALQTKAGGQEELLKWETDNGFDSPESFRTALALSLDAAWMRDKIVSAVPKTADQVHVQQILLYNEGDANAVLEQLQIGADFNALAAQYDPNTRGDLGWFPKGYLLEPAIEQAAFSLQVGEYSAVIQTSVGWSIIKVLEHDANHPLSPDAYLAMQQLALKDWVSQQRAAANVVLAP